MKLDFVIGKIQTAIVIVTGYQGVALRVGIISIFLYVIYRLSLILLATLYRNAKVDENNKRLTYNLWRYIFLAASFLIIATYVFGSLAALGLSAAFVGMVLGWSLQKPVTGIAAWIMLVMKRPFRIGDRVIISGICGDVSDINPMYVVLHQVGGTIGGEENCGRGILIPNAILFDQIITNYSFETQYILDEVLVRLTFDSDLKLAKELMVAAANEVTGEIIADTGHEPFIRMDFYDFGIFVRLRYQTIGSDRQRISSEITERIFDLFAQSDKVHFAYPHNVNLVSMVGGPAGERPAHTEFFKNEQAEPQALH